MRGAPGPRPASRPEPIRRPVPIRQTTKHSPNFAIRSAAFWSSARTGRAVGLTPRQHQALLAIRGFGGGRPANVGDLAERLRIRHHSAAELIVMRCDGHAIPLGWSYRLISRELGLSKNTVP